MLFTAWLDACWNDRALGDPEYKLKGGQSAVIAAPEVRRLRLRPGDAAIILASDGLWDVMDDSEAVDVVEKVPSLPLPFAGFCRFLQGWNTGTAWRRVPLGKPRRLGLDRVCRNAGASDSVLCLLTYLHACWPAGPVVPARGGEGGGPRGRRARARGVGGAGRARGARAGTGGHAAPQPRQHHRGRHAALVGVIASTDGMAPRGGPAVMDWFQGVSGLKEESEEGE